MHESTRSAMKANASAASAIAACALRDTEINVLLAQNYTLQRVSGDMVVEAAASAAARVEASAAVLIQEHGAASRKRERDMARERDGAVAQRHRAEHNAAVHAQARARSENGTDLAVAARIRAETLLHSAQLALNVVDAERERQRKASTTRNTKKVNEARARKRVATQMQLLKAEVSAQRESMIVTRKSAAPKAHHTAPAILAQLGIRDAGRLASGRVGAVIKAFDAYRADGKSFNLRPASSSTIDRWLWKRYLVELLLQNDEIHGLLATAKTGMMSSADMSSMLGSELLVSALCLCGSFVLVELDVDGEPKVTTFVHKYEVRQYFLARDERTTLTLLESTAHRRTRSSQSRARGGRTSRGF